MLLTAQRVRSPHGDVGINRYAWRHAGSVQVEDLDIATSRGELVHRSYEVAPGNNTVLSFLDVYTPDDTNMSDVVDWLARVARGPEPKQFPCVIRQGGLVLRFGLGFGLMATWRDELRHLAGSALLLASDVAEQGATA